MSKLASEFCMLAAEVDYMCKLFQTLPTLSKVAQGFKRGTRARFRPVSPVRQIVHE